MTPNGPAILQARLRCVTQCPRLVIERPDLRRAAVLVPFVWRDGEARVILTVRTMSVATHKGQISFPGGHVDPEDRTPIDTALREAQEEIGLAPPQVEILGLIDDMATSTSYLITPVVGIVDPCATLRRDESEVAAIFEAPVSTLLDPTNHEYVTVEHAGACHRFHRYTVDDHIVWGATAGILHGLLKTLEA